MSNAIYIVDLAANGIEQPADTLAGLWKQIEPLLLNAGTPSPKYVELATGLEEAIRSRAAKRMSLKKVQEGLEQPKQQAQTLETGAWAYGLPEDDGGAFDNGHILHAIVLQAMALNLVVLADYLGVAFLPGEELIVESDLDVDWALLFDEPLEEPEAKPSMTRAQMIKRVLAMLGDKLKPHGFVLSKEKFVDVDGVPNLGTHRFVREIGEGRQFINAIPGSFSYDGLIFMFNASGQNRLLHPVLLDAFPERRNAALRNPLFAEDYSLHLSFIDVYQKWCASGRHSDIWPVASVKTNFSVQIEHGPFLQEAVDELLDVHLEAYLPILDAITDVRGILRLFLRGHGQLVETDVAMQSGNHRAAIVAGHLAKDPVLPQFVQAVIDYVQKNSMVDQESKDRYIGNIHQLIDYLQKNVPQWEDYKGSVK